MRHGVDSCPDQFCANRMPYLRTFCCWSSSRLHGQKIPSLFLFNNIDLVQSLVLLFCKLVDVCHLQSTHWDCVWVILNSTRYLHVRSRSRSVEVLDDRVSNMGHRKLPSDINFVAVERLEEYSSGDCPCRRPVFGVLVVRN